MSAIYDEASCDICGMVLSSKTVRVHCADPACADDWDACVTCFASGGSKPDSAHKTTHAYRLISPVERPLFTQDWSGDEELLLLQGSEKYGLGNWADVAEHIGNRRTKEECDRHYLETYIKSRTYPLPDLDVQIEYDAEAFQARKRRRIEARAAIQKVPPVTKSKPVASTPSCHEVQGYMPGRLEFEHEYENDAEVSVKDLEFDADLAEGNDDEVQLKLTMLDIYNSRLTRRADRKRVIFEHNMLEYKKNQLNDKKRTKEEKDLIARAKPFARLLSSQDYDLFVEGLLNEHHLRKRIAELQEWRRLGLTAMEQGPKYEKDKAHRQLMRSTNTLSTHGSRYSRPDDKKKHMGMHVGIGQATDAQLLSREEQSLCSNLRLLPKAYLVVKETLLRELWRTGGALSKKNARQLLKIDPAKITKVFEYLLQFGLVA